MEILLRIVRFEPTVSIETDLPRPLTVTFYDFFDFLEALNLWLLFDGAPGESGVADKPAFMDVNAGVESAVVHHMINGQWTRRFFEDIRSAVTFKIENILRFYGIKFASPQWIDPFALPRSEKGELVVDE